MNASARLLAAAVLLCGAGAAQAATDTAPAKTPVPNFAVSAPNAQALVLKLGAEHKDIALLGLHANVPNSTNNGIIACTDAARIGKPSSPGDLALVGKPKIMVARIDKKNVYEVAMAVFDAQGNPFGMMVDQMPISQISDEADALRRALAVRAELQRGIQSEAWLFAGK